jgi:hypothetical protein
MLFTEKREGEVSMLFHEPEGVALRSDIADSYGQVPQHPASPPACRHGIEVIYCTGSYEHPVISDQFEKIISKLCYRYVHIYLPCCAIRDNEAIKRIISDHPEALGRSDKKLQI